jgi:hypothetical protein
MINSAENDIAGIIGYFPAPKWIYEEVQLYERPFRRDFFGDGLNIRDRYKGVKAKYAKYVNAGRRAVSIIDTATTAGGTLVYTDADSDGMYDTATITLPTTLTDVREIKIYFNGLNGEEAWEIRPIRQKTISGGNVVIVADAWYFIDPELAAAHPNYDDGFPIFDLQNTDDLVTSVDVYREYTDTTQASAQFLWESSYADLCSCCSTGCEVCSQYTLTGCITARDRENGYLLPVPATYDETDERWEKAVCTDCPEPEMVRLWYKAGEQDDAYKSGVTFDPLSQYWAETIAWVVTARLGRPLCDCNNVHAFAEILREDVTVSTREASHFVAQDDLRNPLGTHYGEIMAWRRIKHSIPDKKFSYLLI